MEGTFSLPYSEYDTIRQLLDYFPKRSGYGIYIPVSRQQQGVDFLISRSDTSRVLKCQVKSSRSYHWEGTDYPYRFWYNNFIKTYRRGVADVYFFFGLYPVHISGRKVTESSRHWRSIILAVPDRRIRFILSKARTNKGKYDRFWSFGIGISKSGYANRVVGTRSGLTGYDLTRYLLEHQSDALQRMLK